MAPVTFTSNPHNSGYQSPPFLSQNSNPDHSYYNVAYRQNTVITGRDTFTTTIRNPLSTNDVPVTIAAATSSVAMGFIASEDISGHLDVSYLGEDFALSFTLDGKKVTHTDVSDFSLGDNASKKAVRLADGGPVDNSGVAQLVSFLQQNQKATGFNIVAFDNVQAGYTPKGGKGAEVGTDFAYLFGKGLPRPKIFCIESYCVTTPDLKIFDYNSLKTTKSTWSQKADTGSTMKQVIYTQYQVTTVDNPVFGITKSSTGRLHAFSCIYPSAETVPMNKGRDEAFFAYDDMLNFINNSLNENGQEGLKHLQAALQLSE